MDAGSNAMDGQPDANRSMQGSILTSKSYRSIHPENLHSIQKFSI